jgi:hypothetical protein
MTSTAIQLKQNNQTLLVMTTNSLGQFNLGALDSGTYQLEFEHIKPWGGVNATDALLLAQHFSGLTAISGLPLLAADVNVSLIANNSDALLIMRRFTNSIDSFPTTDWIYGVDSFYIGPRDSIHLDIPSLCMGDLDGSNTPNTQLRQRWDEIKEWGDVVEMKNGALSFPIYTLSPIAVGAASIQILLPPGVRVLSVEGGLAQSMGSVLNFHQMGRELRIAWYNIEEQAIASNEVVFLLILEGNMNEVPVLLGNLSELVNTKGEPVNHELAMPLIRKQSSSDEFSAFIYPNPAMGWAKVRLQLPYKSRVIIHIKDVFGRLVQQYEETEMHFGSSEFDLNTSNLASGHYWVEVTSVDETFGRKVLKLQVN